MANYYSVNGMTADVLVPVPLHELRIRERGYNQSGLLAGEISRNVGIPVNERLLKRTRNCKPQARTGSVEERRRNMENAFGCTGNGVKGLDIVVIDDVCTTGATLEACAAVLKAAGAKRVMGFTLAREIKKQE
jgi:ComF family protein